MMPSRSDRPVAFPKTTRTRADNLARAAAEVSKAANLVPALWRQEAAFEAAAMQAAINRLNVALADYLRTD